jgi:hypothetical protein
MTMRNPPQPAEILRGLCIEPLGLTGTDAAEALTSTIGVPGRRRAEGPPFDSPGRSPGEVPKRTARAEGA